MKKTFFARRALLILVIVFFLLPFAMRGARLSLTSMQNNIKDWLPDRFLETMELDWFREHFLGEQFVICSWEGCTEDDQKLKLFREKILPETEHLSELTDDQRAKMVEREKAVGDRYGLYFPENNPRDWGGLNEKWFQGRDDDWFYITPDGNLYRWEGQQTLLGVMGRGLSRMVRGKSVQGTLVEELEPLYYERPYRIEARLFKTVTTGPEILEQMSRDGSALRRDHPEEKAREIALERLTGSLFGPDGKQTCLIVTLTEEGRHNLERVVGRGLPGHPRGKLIQYAEQSGINPPAQPPMLAIPSLGIGIPPEPPAPALKMGGPPVDNTAIDEEGQITLVRLVGLCGLLGFGLSFLCFRSFKITFMLFFVGGVAAIASLSAVWWLGSSVDAVLMSMPAVVYVLGLSGAVHIVNYYKDAIEEHGLIGAPERAVAHGWWPCTLAAVTTAIGLLSLCTSELKPIWKFGLFSAIGVMGTLVLLFTYLPSALQLWPPSLALKDSKTKREPWPIAQWFSRLAEATGNGIIRYNVPVAIACTIILVAFGWGLWRINTSVHLIKMFDSNSKIISDYRWLENNLGVLVPMEIVLRFDKEMLYWQKAPPGAGESGEEAPAKRVDPRKQFTFGDRIAAVARVHELIEQEFGEEGNGLVGRGMSVATFTPELPPSGGSNEQINLRNLYSRRLEAHRDEFIDSDYLRYDNQDGAELWRISMRVAALKNIDYGSFVADLKCAVEPVMAAYRFRDEILEKMERDQILEELLSLDPSEQERVRRELLNIAPEWRGQLLAEIASLNQTKGDRRREEISSAQQRRPYPIPEAIVSLDPNERDQAFQEILKLDPVERDRVLKEIWGLLPIRRNLEEVKYDEYWDVRFAKVRVLAIGAPYKRYYERLKEKKEASEQSAAPAETATADVGETNEPATGSGSEDRLVEEIEHREVDQTRIFAMMLRDLLRNMRVTFVTHDPTRESAEELQKDLAKAKYVLWVGDHESYDMTALREQLSDRLIDVRDHRFDPAIAQVPPSVAQEDAELPAVSAVYTGIVPVVYKASRTLLNNLVSSIFWAFVMIGFVMIFLLRNPGSLWPNVPAGLASMLPNVFPVVVIFGAMGWMGIDIDIGTMMTASVAMGVAVDDTIHFLTWYRWGLAEGLGRVGAIQEAYRRVGRAMAQTTAIGGLGMFVFALSTFTPTQMFGILMLALLLAALVGDLVFLPAILAGPVGRVFTASAKDKKPDAGPGQAAEARDVAAGVETPAPETAPAAAVAGPLTQGAPVETPHSAGRTERAGEFVLRQDTSHNVPPE
jgi:predicted RND superfamily exporter protein